MPDSDHHRCPICLAESRPTWMKSGYQLFACTACEHLFCEAGCDENYIETVYGDAYFDGGGGGYSNYLQHEAALIAQGKKYASILKRHISPGRVIDIGAAAGFILKGFDQQAWDVFGVEPNQSMAELAKSRFGLEVEHGSLDDVEESQPFDAALLIQVISHLQDPLASLQKMNRLLRPGGLLLVETWNRKSMTARMFGKSWHQYNPPSVLHWFTKPHLQMMLEKSGFKVIQRGRPTKWISINNGLSLVEHSSKDSKLARLASLPLKMIPRGMKVPYFLDDVFWFVAQKTE